MRTKEIEIGTYTEWKEKNQAVANTILEKNRGIVTECCGWEEDNIESFCKKVYEQGFNINVIDVNYSGFGSQGDGASFTGTVNILKFLKANKILSSYRALTGAIKNGYINDVLDIERITSRYFHENTCSTEEIEEFNCEALTPKVEDEMEKIHSLVEKERSDLCRTLYTDLEKTYAALNSDENVIDVLIANEYDFTRNGEIA